MIFNGTLSGQFVDLRMATEADAEFIIQLRQREEVVKYMHSVGTSIENQVQWIKDHQLIDGDIYFLIWSKGGRRIGTVSLYNKRNDRCEIGRLASIGNAAENVEAFLLAFDYAFNELKYNYLDGTVAPDNISMKSLANKFGIVHDKEICNIDGLQLQHGCAKKADYFAKRPKIIELLETINKLSCN